MTRPKRKVVQITVATAVEDGIERERLYALDSTGTIWFWTEGGGKRSAGWIEMAAPWDAESEMYPKQPSNVNKQPSSVDLSKPLDKKTFMARLKVVTGEPVTFPPGQKTPF